MPRRIRAGDRVVARVDVAVAGAVAESLVIERAERAGHLGPGAPGLDPPGDAGDDDVIYAVRGERRRRWLVRLGARRRRAVWALFAAERTDAVTLRARAALGGATATCEAPVSVVAAAPRATGCVAPVSAALDAGPSSSANLRGSARRPYQECRCPRASRSSAAGASTRAALLFVDGGGAADVAAAGPASSARLRRLRGRVGGPPGRRRHRSRGGRAAPARRRPVHCLLARACA